MVAWWPFQQSGGAASSSSSSSSSSTVPTFPGAQDTHTYEDVQSGKTRNYGDSGVAQSEIDRMRDMQKIRRHNDARANVMDTESIDTLVSRFEKEFRAADAHMKERAANQHLLQRYDYDNDRRYAQWKEDQKALRERLHIHPLDTVIDDSTACFIYLLRICTTAGLCYGVGRTAFLYRTMDKTYAKLNGVTLGGIAFNEITSSVAKSACVALAGAFGVPVGDSFTSLCRAVYLNDVAKPDRSWWNIFGAGVSCGLCSGVAFTGLHYKDLTPWGMRAVVGGFTSIGAVAGLYLGYCVYRPFAQQRKHDLYDPYWRPWQERHLRGDGPHIVRGKYM